MGSMRRIVHPILAVLAPAALVLGGCAALDTRMPKPDVSLPAAYEAPAGAPAGAGPEALDRWWLLFDDPQLTGLIEEALKASPDAKSAFGRLREANATMRETIAGLFPQGDVKGSVTAEHVGSQYSNLSSQFSQFLGAFSGAGDDRIYSGGLNVSWELDLFGRDFTAVRGARATAAAQRFDYEATRMSLAASVATGLFQARGLAIELADARENARLAHDLARVGRRKAEAGLGSEADAARLEADALALDAQISQTDALLKGAIRSLLALVGRGAAPSSSLVIGPVASPPPAVPATTPGALLARRPDVREAEMNVRVAAARLKFDKLALLPTFTLEPSYQYSKQVQPSLTEITSTTAGAIGVTVPLLSLPKLLEEIKAQGARGEQAVAAYEKAVQSAYGDAERGLTTLQSDNERVALLRTATDKSRYAYDAARKGYDLGLTDLTTLVQAEQAWRQTRSTYTSATTSALVDAVSTFKALGGGWPASGPEHPGPEHPGHGPNGNAR